MLGGAAELGISLGALALSQQWGTDLASVWFDADFGTGTFVHNGTSYASEALFLGAAGGVVAGSGRVFGPRTFGANLLADGGFDTGIAGWARSPMHGGTAVSWQAGHLRVDKTGTDQSRFSTAIAVVPGKAYRHGASMISSTLTGSAQTLVSTSPDLTGGFAQTTSYFSGALPQSRQAFFGASTEQLYLGAVTNPGGPTVELWDDFSVQEAVPLVGHNHLSLSGRIEATTPAGISGNKVLWQADDSSERNRIRLVWDSGGRLRLVTTSGAVEQANIDLGVVASLTGFAVEFSCARDDVCARLDTGPWQADVVAAHPGICVIRLGRSSVGEAWDGAIHRVTLSSGPSNEMGKLVLWGDSLIQSLGAVLGSGLDPKRAVHNGGVGGQAGWQIKARMLADTRYRERTAIIWDRKNDGITAGDYLVDIAQIVARVWRAA